MDDPTRITARRVLEARLGRKLGPISIMPRDIRKALFFLALQLNNKSKR
tara:strand:- start:55 stop:201 length:147 start_codon:yes stop_codon:yes gene_type:complete